MRLSGPLQRPKSQRCRFRETTFSWYSMSNTELPNKSTGSAVPGARPLVGPKKGNACNEYMGSTESNTAAVVSKPARVGAVNTPLIQSQPHAALFFWPRQKAPDVRQLSRHFSSPSFISSFGYAASSCFARTSALTSKPSFASKPRPSVYVKWDEDIVVSRRLRTSTHE